MRAANYLHHREAYTPWSHTDMVRAALVEGLATCSLNKLGGEQARHRVNEAQRYRRLLLDYTDLGIHELINRAFDILKQSSLTHGQCDLVSTLTGRLTDSGAWKRMDHSHLEREGVIVRYQGSTIAGLTDLIYHTPEYKVVRVDDFPLDANMDYIKHVPNQHRLLLNGVSVIRAFAEQHDIPLPESFRRTGRLTEEVREILEESQYTFNAAFEAAVAVMQADPGRFISMFAIRNSDGNEVRIFPYELIVGTELFFEISASPTREITMRHGDLDGEFSYNGFNIFGIPRRAAFKGNTIDDPSRSATHDEVGVHYMPHIERPREMVLEWMDTRTSCNCDSSLNLRNFELRRGRMNRVVYHHDAHARVIIHYVADIEGITARNDEYGLIIYPTSQFVGLVDRFRYNVSDGKGSVGTRNISHLVCEALKIDAPYSKKFTTRRPPKKDVLRPKFLIRQRKKLVA